MKGYIQYFYTTVVNLYWTNLKTLKKLAKHPQQMPSYCTLRYADFFAFALREEGGGGEEKKKKRKGRLGEIGARGKWGGRTLERLPPPPPPHKAMPHKIIKQAKKKSLY